MTNVTIVIDEEVLRRARVRAAGQGTSVNAVLRDELKRYAAGDGANRAADRFLALARRKPGRSTPGPRWTREDLYADRAASRS